jgi:hypothetical protein
VISEVLYFIIFFSNLCFAAIMTQDSGKSIAENDTKLTDQKVFMEAMMSEMRRVMKIEMEQVHERIDQMENRREEQPQNGRNLRRRGRVPPREEDEERYGSGFDEEEDRDFPWRSSRLIKRKLHHRLWRLPYTEVLVLS